MQLDRGRHGSDPAGDGPDETRGEVRSGPNAEAAILEVSGLTVAYGRAAPVVSGFDLAIRRGEFVGLLGESGCGKSTAAYALLGLARPPGRILQGRVAFAGEDLLAMSESRKRQIRGKHIGLIVQNPRGALNPMLRVGRQIGNVWLAHNAGTRGSAEERAVEMLKLVDINDPQRRTAAYAHELSGGMAQRVLIAIALSSTPELLIADEPTSGLDVTIQAQLLDQMWQATRRTGSSVLLVTQETGIVANYCDRVLVMRDGRIAEDMPASAYSRGPRGQARAPTRAAPVQAADAAPVLRVDGLSRFFPVANSTKQVRAVSDVSFDIAGGETLGLVGESGSGKTTVGRCILRLLEPSAGHIVYRGRALNELNATEMRRIRSKLQIVLQDPYDSLDPRWTIGAILSEPLRLDPEMSGLKRRKRIEELLALVDLPANVAAMKPRNLGSGALQRINIARALARDPEFVVLDEPTALLAPPARVSLVDLLRRLQSELGVSFLFISHDLTTVSQICHRIAVMYLSQVVELGSTEQVFRSPRHPYTQALLQSHLDPHPIERRVERQMLTRLAGEIPSPIDLPLGCYLQSRCPNALPRCAGEPQLLESVEDGRLLRCWRARAGDLDHAEGASQHV
jgi:oligopeptide/dipeptide ABC transporter ATP-binding protein